MDDGNCSNKHPIACVYSVLLCMDTLQIQRPFTERSGAGGVSLRTSFYAIQAHSFCPVSVFALALSTDPTDIWCMVCSKVEGYSSVV